MWLMLIEMVSRDRRNWGLVHSKVAESVAMNKMSLAGYKVGGLTIVRRLSKDIWQNASFVVKLGR